MNDLWQFSAFIGKITKIGWACFLDRWIKTEHMVQLKYKLAVTKHNGKIF